MTRVALRRTRRVRVVALVATLALPYVLGAIGLALSARLLETAPLLVLALHPFAPLALLVRPQTGLLAFLVVSVLARVVPRTLAYAAGRWAGAEAVDRIRARTTPGGLRAKTLRAAERGSYPALLLFTSAPISAVAGATGMRLLPYLLVSSVSAIATAAAFAGAATFAATPLQSLLTLAQRNPLLTAVAVAVTAAVLVLVRVLARRRQARAPEVPREEVPEDSGPLPTPGALAPEAPCGR